MPRPTLFMGSKIRIQHGNGGWSFFCNFIRLLFSYILVIIVLFFVHCRRDITISSFKYQKKWNTKILSAGFGEQSIMISEGVYMAGYMPFRKSNTTILESSPIKIKAMYLQFSATQLERKNEEGILFLSADFLGFTGNQIVKIKNLISAKLKIIKDHIFISATHNHSGPDTIGVWGGLSKKVKNHIESSFLKASSNAILSKREVWASFAQIKTKISSINRRKPHLKLIPNDLSLIHFKNKYKATPYITAVFYAAHPIVLGPKNKTLSGDFPAHFVKKAENKFQHKFIYFNGALGDVGPTPIHTNVHDRSGGNERDLEKFSTLLIQNLQKAFLSVQPLVVNQVSIQTQNMTFRTEGQFLLKIFNHLGWINVVRNKNNLLMAPISHISLGDKINFLTIPGELFKIYEYKIKTKYSKKNIFLLGLCNDSLGYFMPQKETETENGVAETFLLNSTNGQRWYKIADKLVSKQ